MKRTSQIIVAAFMALCVANGTAFAQCDEVTFSEVAWTDIAATTHTTAKLLEALGYKTEIKTLSVPATYASMKSGGVDVFLGNWMPSMESIIATYRDEGSVETVRENLEGAKFTLAANKAAADLGIADFADIATHKDALGAKIHGIEPGNDGNRIILDMIESDAFGLGGFELVESSERDMLARVAEARKQGEPVVFLGWEPHPMNTYFELNYLSGGDKYFGPNFGEATVYTNTRKGYSATCPNIGKLLKNLKFSLAMENEIMAAILNDGEDPDDAVTVWLRANASVLDVWLDGVTTKDGGDGLASVKAELGL